MLRESMLATRTWKAPALRSAQLETFSCEGSCSDEDFSKAVIATTLLTNINIAPLSNEIGLRYFFYSMVLDRYFTFVFRLYLPAYSAVK